jgi:hypothetical protein
VSSVRSAPGLGRNRHGPGTNASQTRARLAGIVIAEGGGTTIPTLMGGGCRGLAEAGPIPRDAAL